MWVHEAKLATEWNNFAKLLDYTDRWYQYRKYYTDHKTWYTYLSDAISEKKMKWINYITVNGKNKSISMEEYNLQFIN